MHHVTLANNKSPVVSKYVRGFAMRFVEQQPMQIAVTDWVRVNCKDRDRSCSLVLSRSFPITQRVDFRSIQPAVQ
jgi:hypothetical protein